MLTTTRLDAVALAGVVAILTMAALAPLPNTGTLLDRPSLQAWSEQLDRDLGPVMADCVRFEVMSHLAPRDFDILLANASTDPVGGAIVRTHVDTALDRCTRRHRLD